MQYTSKIALLAVALFGSSAFATSQAGYNLEAREVDNDLSARELFNLYLEARSDPSLDARALESLDFEAREYLEYLEAREAATVASEPPHASEPHQTPMLSQSPPSHVETNEHGAANATTHSESEPKIFLTAHEKSVRKAKKLANKEFDENPKAYEAALADEDDVNHRFAVARYLKTPKHLKQALADLDSPYHKAARRIVHKRKAKVYLSDKHNYKRALNRRHHLYHKDAIKVYLSHGTHFQEALENKDAHFHKIALHEYLLDKKTRMEILSSPSNQYYKEAKKLQKKINKRHHHHHHHHKVSSDPLPANSTTATTTPSA